MTQINPLGLPNFDRNRPFDEIFETIFAPLLGARAEGFRTIFSNLPKDHPVIVETGCLRAPGNWSGDGQSTFMFDLFAFQHNGRFVSIEINEENVAKARQFCRNTLFYVGDGATKLDSIASSGPLDLLYLDSFDAFRDVSIVPAPVHYMLELCAARPALSSGSLVAIDDFHSQETSQLRASKGLGVEMFLEKIGAEVIHDGYMKVWKF